MLGEDLHREVGLGNEVGAGGLKLVYALLVRCHEHLYHVLNQCFLDHARWSLLGGQCEPLHAKRAGDGDADLLHSGSVNCLNHSQCRATCPLVPGRTVMKQWIEFVLL